MLITLKLEDELPVSQTQEVLVSTPSVFVFRGFLFVLLVICKLVEPFLLCVFFTEFHVPFFLVALSLLLKHSSRRNTNTDLQISVLRAKSWCLTFASRPADFSAPTCTSKKKELKSFGRGGWHLPAVQGAKDRFSAPCKPGRRSRWRAHGQHSRAEGKILAPAWGRWVWKVGWAGQGGESRVYTAPLANQPVWESFSCSSASRPPSRSALKRVFMYPSRISSAGADGGGCSCPTGPSLFAPPPEQQEQAGSRQVEHISPFLQRNFCSMEKHILKL